MKISKNVLFLLPSQAAARRHGTGGITWHASQLHMQSLPADVLAGLEDEPSCFNFGWSQGKETLEGGVPDANKGSFYANPLLDNPASGDEDLMRQFPAFCRQGTASDCHLCRRCRWADHREKCWARGWWRQHCRLAHLCSPCWPADVVCPTLLYIATSAVGAAGPTCGRGRLCQSWRGHSKLWGS